MVASFGDELYTDFKPGCCATGSESIGGFWLIVLLEDVSLELVSFVADRESKKPPEATTSTPKMPVLDGISPITRNAMRMRNAGVNAR